MIIVLGEFTRYILYLMVIIVTCNDLSGGNTSVRNTVIELIR